jgi:23S rRNA pseudouridine2605 synthase
MVSDMERLQKILAHAGIASRRKAEELIAKGRVRVNGRVVTELGTKVDPENDKIQVNDQKIRRENLVYVVLHKPKGYLSDIDEGRGKPLAVGLVDSRERLYPAGRLDANSEGLLLLTNDGELAHRITHPRYGHQKEYLALVEGEPSIEALMKLSKGIWYDGEMLRADRAERTGRHQRFGNAHPSQSWIKIVLHEGKKRQVRHMCAAVGHPAVRLIRTRIGSIELGSLPAGEWRSLTPAQINELKKTSEKKNLEAKHHRD